MNYFLFGLSLLTTQALALAEITFPGLKYLGENNASADLKDFQDAEKEWQESSIEWKGNEWDTEDALRDYTKAHQFFCLKIKRGELPSDINFPSLVWTYTWLKPMLVDQDRISLDTESHYNNRHMSFGHSSYDVESHKWLTPSVSGTHAEYFDISGYLETETVQSFGLSKDYLLVKATERFQILTTTGPSRREKFWSAPVTTIFKCRTHPPI